MTPQVEPVKEKNTLAPGAKIANRTQVPKRPTVVTTWTHSFSWVSLSTPIN